MWELRRAIADSAEADGNYKVRKEDGNCQTQSVRQETTLLRRNYNQLVTFNNCAIER